MKPAVLTATERVVAAAARAGAVGDRHRHGQRQVARNVHHPALAKVASVGRVCFGYGCDCNLEEKKKKKIKEDKRKKIKNKEDKRKKIKEVRR